MFVFKRFFLIFMICVPMYGFGADSCTNPNEYKIDKRCYVDNAKKKTKPYNAVIGIVKSEKTKPHCTGTIVSQNNKLYLYTAKHCVIDDAGNVQNIVKIRTQDRKFFDVYKNLVGNYERLQTVNSDNEKSFKFYNFFGDWAIYDIKDNDLSFVNLVSEAGEFRFDNEARVIGYGILKVMSDKEIAEFRQKYIDYLKSQKNMQDKRYTYGLHENHVTETHQAVKGFISEFLKNNEKDYYNNFFTDNNFLKESKCEYIPSGQYIGCQTWSGNSGGGIFDRNGNLMGIHKNGNRHIGGSEHAMGVSSINLQHGLPATETLDAIKRNELSRGIEKANKALQGND